MTGAPESPHALAPRRFSSPVTRQLDLGALLFATLPLMTLAIATAAGHERFDGPLAAGVLLSILGVGVALGVRPATIMGRAGFALGAVCALGAALCGALCSVLFRPLLLRHATLPLGTLAMGAAVSALAPAAWAEGLFTQAQALPLAPIGVGLVGGMVCIVLGLVLTASRRVSLVSAPHSP